jgi:hypothetical protein
MIGRSVVAVILLIALLVTALRDRLREVAATATTAAEALDDGSVDFLAPEVARLLGALDGVAERLVDICERLAAGVDPQGAPADRHPFDR